jgi:ferredoxin-nitrite reductase
LTGCPNSCAQHYVGDIGLLATKVEKSEEEEVEGYHVLVGGGTGAEAKLGREIYRSIPASEMPQRIETMLRGFLAHRAPGETFQTFANRLSAPELTRLFEACALAEG